MFSPRMAHLKLRVATLIMSTESFVVSPSHRDRCSQRRRGCFYRNVEENCAVEHPLLFAFLLSFRARNMNNDKTLSAPHKRFYSARLKSSFFIVASSSACSHPITAQRWNEKLQSSSALVNWVGETSAVRRGGKFPAWGFHSSSKWLHSSPHSTTLARAKSFSLTFETFLRSSVALSLDIDVARLKSLKKAEKALAGNILEWK